MNERIIFERILCPIDLTSDSEESLRYGIHLSKAYGAKLFVIRCTEYEGNHSDQRQIKAYLRDVIAKHVRQPASNGPETETIVAKGDPQVAIAREAAERRVDLIVMRSRRRPYAAALLGSTTESICRTAPCPILITHPREREWVGMTT